jgi:hypothetical protein
MAAAAALAAAARAGSEAEVRAIVAAINAKIAEGNRKAASGPPLNLAPFDPSGWSPAGTPPARASRPGARTPA